ncbi:hypothetical protein GCM10018793_63140 [Streptomyces sulfonofaciens]|uniref:Uncharacterized protein n=1 Tax=Streptomyces sulfonofaciens TaxID=68272 RepID=A0A919GNP3_9ACTN|nr:hypothetical protein [Streptomyces sulfonofaciens]GHH87423.1 hypothetical protein GCM10018793_63140 [Streptomyces sulfonofaciens]
MRGISWSSAVDQMIAACDTVIGLGARTIVPGHGPVTDNAGAATVKRYFRHVRDEARRQFDAGVPALGAAFDLDLGGFADWRDSERVVATVDALYREWDPGHPPADPVRLFRHMGRYHRRATGGAG